ncbi:hypothetical protein [Acidiferrobacter sp.]|uniref:hypothetical protein n=1 Tax=Acidiferrobacter sp. TaxID=1872107 RepID=UPI0026364506|nr:hypothetical protein [Acidiferrobacter sp.]
MNSASLVADLLGYLAPTRVYRAAAPVAAVLMRTVTPSLFVVALYTRLLEAQLDSVSGAGQLARVVRDAAVWGVVLTAYFALGGLVNHYLNALYAAMGRIGSLRLVATQMATLLATAAKGPSGVWGTIKEINALPLRLATVLLYYATLVMTTFLEALLRIAQAIGYEFAFLYGLVAIPLALSRTLSLVRGFAKLLGFFILWPVVQALLLAVFSPLFTHAVSALQGLLGKADYMIVYAHMLFTILNLVLCAVLLAAPYITASLIENAGAAQPVLSPYLGAISQFGATLATGVDRGAAKAADIYLHGPDEDILSLPPGRMPELHIPPDPNFWPSAHDGSAVRTNYLHPQYDGPPKSEQDDDFSRR